MTNLEFYKDKLDELAKANDGFAVVNGRPCICRGEVCDDGVCEFHKDRNCSVQFYNWLTSEYKDPKIDWSKVEVDTPILVRDFLDSNWTKRHFAKYENGEVYVWSNGYTSWTSDIHKNCVSWKYAKLAEEDK